MTIKDGFYGAYITDGETNRTLPKQYTPESIEVAEAFRLLAEKRAAGPSTRRGRKGAAAKKTSSAAKSTVKKSATKKTTSGKTSSGKTAAKKPAAKKPTVKKAATKKAAATRTNASKTARTSAKA